MAPETPAWSDDLKFGERWTSLTGPRVILGVDGGGTSTICVALEAGRPAGAPFNLKDVLGRGVSGSSNRNSVGDTVAREALEEAIADSLRECQLPRLAVQAVCVGMSGVDGPADVALVRGWLGAIFSHPVEVEVYNDSVVALASGTGGYLRGAVLITGTGTIAFGVASDGRTARAGGAGPVLGDRGSGYAIAVEALGAVMRAGDGRCPPTALTQAILTHLRLESPQDLINWTYRDNEWSRIAALVPVVKACAAGGDGVALRVLQEGIAELALSVKAVATTLQLGGPEGLDTFPLTLVGGLLSQHSEWNMLGPLVAELERVVPAAIPVCPEVEPAFGAAMLATRRLEGQGKVKI